MSAALAPPLGDESGVIGAREGKAVVLVSWMREEGFWKGEMRRGMVCHIFFFFFFVDSLDCRRFRTSSIRREKLSLVYFGGDRKALTAE